MKEDIEIILNKISGNVVFKKDISSHQAILKSIPKDLHSKLYMYAKMLFPQGLYLHQSMSIAASLKGKHVAINTSTASGKSLCFILPVLNELIKDPLACSLIVFPIKALSNDQLKNLHKWVNSLKLGHVLQKFDGDIKGKERQEAIKNGRLLVCTPDVVHTTLLRMNKEEYYRDFFKNLKYIVLDECHTYSGAFGSHMAMVIRRLRQVCENHNSQPQFILSSATVGCPDKHAMELTGLTDFEIISEDYNGSPTAGKSYYMVKPPEENAMNTFAIKLTHNLIEYGKRFLTFCNTRQEVENLFTLAFPKDREKVMPYRAGYEPKDRAAIETSLSNGNLAGVFCTSALEMGIDLSHLDVCVMIGLPGNKISMLQRAGRVGRKTPGAVIICAGNSPYDNYFLNHPDELFDRPLEELVINLENKQILMDHFACARAESKSFEQPRLNESTFGTPFMQIAKQINLYDYPEEILYEQYPHFKVSIRCVDDPSYDIILGRRGDDPVIGQINYSQILREAFRGAIYLHLGKRYRVQNISYGKRQIFVDARCPMVQTKPRTEIFVKPRISSQVGESKVWPGLKVWETSLSITEKVTGYIEKIGKQKLEQIYEQPMMRYFVTNGAIVSLGGQNNLTHGAVLGLATALENAYPIVYNCAKEDICSYAWSKDNSEAQIYLFDSTAGGLSITQNVVTLFEKLLEVVAHSVSKCPSCSEDYETKDYGCVKCVLSNSWFNYPANTRRETIFLINELMMLIKEKKPIESRGHKKLDIYKSLNYQHSDKSFGRTMITNGSLVYTGKHQEGVIIESKPFSSGIIEDRIYTIQIGKETVQYLGNNLTLIQGKVERWCLNCGEELIDFGEINCPICGVNIT